MKKKNGTESTGKEEKAGTVRSVDLTNNLVRILTECKLETGDCIRVAGLQGSHPIRSLILNDRVIKRARVGEVVHAEVDRAAARRIAKLIGADVHHVLEAFEGS